MAFRPEGVVDCVLLDRGGLLMQFISQFRCKENERNMNGVLS